MNITYNDIEEKLEFYCHNCGTGISQPPVQTNIRFIDFIWQQLKFML